MRDTKYLNIHDMEIREEGREEGEKAATVKGIRRAMEKLNMTMESAMEYMAIPPAEQPAYALLLQECTDAGKWND